MLSPCQQRHPDVYSISSETLIRLVLEEGKHPAQCVWTPAAPDMASSLYTHLMSLPTPPTLPTYTKTRGHPVKWLSTDLIHTKINTWLCAMLSGMYWYWLEIYGWWRSKTLLGLWGSKCTYRYDTSVKVWFTSVGQIYSFIYFHKSTHQKRILKLILWFILLFCLYWPS